MATADEYQDLGGGRFHWQAFDPAVKTELMCSALHANDAWFFIDPAPLAPSAMAELAERCVGAGAILLTNANHERAAQTFRDRFRIPVVAHRDAAPEITIPLDRTVEDGELVFDQFQVVALPGAARGEVAYFHSAGATLWVGDALVHAEPFGFAPLPKKYCEDAKALHAALPRLLQFPFDDIFFAHGAPILGEAHARLSGLLGSIS